MITVEAITVQMIAVVTIKLSLKQFKYTNNFLKT